MSTGCHPLGVEAAACAALSQSNRAVATASCPTGQNLGQSLTPAQISILCSLAAAAGLVNRASKREFWPLAHCKCKRHHKAFVQSGIFSRHCQQLLGNSFSGFLTQCFILLAPGPCCAHPPPYHPIHPCRCKQEMRKQHLLLSKALACSSCPHTPATPGPTAQVSFLRGCTVVLIRYRTAMVLGNESWC